MENECKNCGGCCKHIALEIDTPEDRDDFEDIYWYLLHQNVRVFVTEKDSDEDEDDNSDESASESDDNDNNDDESWFIEFQTRCKGLDENNMCKVYEKRPKICAGYDPDQCTASGGDSEELHSFSNSDEFLDYLKEEYDIVLKP